MKYGRGAWEPEVRRMPQTKVAMIGDGNVGTALSKGLVRARYEVQAIGKVPEKVRELARWGDIIVLAVPFTERANARSSALAFGPGKSSKTETSACTLPSLAREKKRSARRRFLRRRRRTTSGLRFRGYNLWRRNLRSRNLRRRNLRRWCIRRGIRWRGIGWLDGRWLDVGWRSVGWRDVG